MPQDRLLPIALVLAALAHLSTACCDGDSNYLTFGIGEMSGYTTVLWGESMEWSRPVVEASFPREQSLAGEPLEVWQDGQRVEVSVVTDDVNNALNNGCGWSTNLLYDLQLLPAGTYTLVHRRDTGSGGRINCLDRCPWVEFEGEEALTMELVVVEQTSDAATDVGQRDVSDADGAENVSVGDVSGG